MWRFGPTKRGRLVGIKRWEDVPHLVMFGAGISEMTGWNARKGRQAVQLPNAETLEGKLGAGEKKFFN